MLTQTTITYVTLSELFPDQEYAWYQGFHEDYKGQACLNLVALGRCVGTEVVTALQQRFPDSNLTGNTLVDVECGNPPSRS